MGGFIQTAVVVVKDSLENRVPAYCKSYQWMKSKGTPPNKTEAITKSANFMVLNLTGLILSRIHSP